MYDISTVVATSLIINSLIHAQNLGVEAIIGRLRTPPPSRIPGVRPTDPGPAPAPFPNIGYEGGGSEGGASASAPREAPADYIEGAFPRQSSSYPSETTPDDIELRSSLHDSISRVLDGRDNSHASAISDNPEIRNLLRDLLGRPEWLDGIVEAIAPIRMIRSTMTEHSMMLHNMNATSFQILSGLAALVSAVETLTQATKDAATSRVPQPIETGAQAPALGGPSSETQTLRMVSDPHTVATGVSYRVDPSISDPGSLPLSRNAEVVLSSGSGGAPDQPPQNITEDPNITEPPSNYNRSVFMGGLSLLVLFGGLLYTLSRGAGASGGGGSSGGSGAGGGGTGGGYPWIVDDGDPEFRGKQIIFLFLFWAIIASILAFLKYLRDLKEGKFPWLDNIKGGYPWDLKKIFQLLTKLFLKWLKFLRPIWKWLARVFGGWFGKTIFGGFIIASMFSFKGVVYALLKLSKLAISLVLKLVVICVKHFSIICGLVLLALCFKKQIINLFFKFCAKFGFIKTSADSFVYNFLVEAKKIVLEMDILIEQYLSKFIALFNNLLPIQILILLKSILSFIVVLVPIFFFLNLLRRLLLLVEDYNNKQVLKEEYKRLEQKYELYKELDYQERGSDSIIYTTDKGRINNILKQREEEKRTKESQFWVPCGILIFALGQSLKRVFV